MSGRATILTSLALLGSVALFAAATPASALTMKECSAKYKIAQKDGSAKNVKWNDFRKAQCGADAAPAPAAAAVPAAEPKEAAKKTAKKEARDTAKEAAAPAAPAGPAVYPNAVDAKYAKEKAAKQRMQTCLDQYNANKTSNGNGGMKWIQKGGGYYSECNKKLKGSA